MNIENLLKVFQYKGSDACFSCQHSTLQPTIDFTLTLSNLFLWSGMMCYILGPREQDSLPGLLRQRVSSSGEGLWPTDGHVTTLLSLPPLRGWRLVNWWWRDTGWTLVSQSPGPLTLRSPRPVTGVNDQFTPRMQAKHSHTNPANLPPASCFAG